MVKETREAGKNYCFDYKGFELFKYLLILPWFFDKKNVRFWGNISN
ncbi:MAG: hypothetical protein NC410_00895 [Oscillibacter sp.]|nr:hypothetical protein [Oscillibacter sp.]